MAPDSGAVSSTDFGDEQAPSSGPEQADISCLATLNNPAQMPATARDYVALCQQHGLGVPPTVSCDEAVRVPTTVDGQEVFESPQTCDHTSMLKPVCNVGAKIQRHGGRDVDGTPLPDVIWVHFCRATAVTESSSVQMIGYHQGTGATCFFEANEGSDSILPELLGRDEFNGLTGQMPAPDESDFDRAFIPAPGQCVQCHQNNPFIRNPWLDGAVLPENPSEPVLPTLGAESPYYVVGGADWDMRTIHIEGNECLTCHRIGMEIDRIFADFGFDVNTYMPPHAPGTMSGAYQELLNCWLQGPEATPGCDWIIPPAGDCVGGVVASDYPYASTTFNPSGRIGTDDDSDKPDITDNACPEEAVVGAPCEGDPLGSACLVDGLDGAWLWCEDGVWTNEK